MTHIRLLRGTSWVRDHYVSIEEPDAGPVIYLHVMTRDGFGRSERLVSCAEALQLVARYGVGQ